MFWVFFQVVLALAIAVAIVWWTIPKKKDPNPPAKRDDSNPS